MTVPAVDSLGMTNLYNVDYLNNPYYMMYSNCPYYMDTTSFKGAETSSNTNTDNDTLKQLQAQQLKAEENKKGNAGTVFGLLTLAGATALTIAAYKKGGDGKKVFERIGNGYKTMFNSLKMKFVKDKISVTEINGNKVVKIPGKRNIIKPDNSGKITTELEKIGENFTEENFANLVNENGKLKDGYKIARFQIDLGDNRVASYSAKSSKIRVYEIIKNSKGNKVYHDITAGYKPKEEFNTLREKVNKIINGEINANNLNNITLRHTNPDTGLLTSIKYTKENNTMPSKVMSAISDKFLIDSKEVAKYEKEYPKFGEDLKAYKEGKTDGLKIIQANVPTTIGTFTVNKNGEILSLVNNDGKKIAIDSEAFKTLKEQNTEIFNSVTNQEKWENKVYQLL